MPTHLAIGDNQLSGTVQVTNSRIAIIPFGKTFNKRPHFNFSLGEGTTTSTPFRQIVQKHRAIVVFRNNYTGEIDWTVVASIREYG